MGEKLTLPFRDEDHLAPAVSIDLISIKGDVHSAEVLSDADLYAQSSALKVYTSLLVLLSGRVCCCIFLFF